MANDALERLFNSNNSQNEDENYSLEEQLESALQNEAEETDDFLDGMSEKSRQLLNSKITEVTLDDSPNALFNNVPEQPSVKPIAQNVNPTSPNNTNETIDFTPVQQSPTEEPITIMKPIENTSVAPEPKINETVSSVENTTTEDEVPHKKRGRKKKVIEPVESVNHDVDENAFGDLFVPVMNQLAKDLIDQLIAENYKIARFDDKNMKILYDYMYNKF